MPTLKRSWLSVAVMWAAAMQLDGVLVSNSDHATPTRPKNGRSRPYFGPRHEPRRSRFDTKTPPSCMAVAHRTTTDSHERLRVDTQQHLPTFASKSVFEPSTGLMDRDSQHRPMTLTTRAHELTKVGGYALLMVAIHTTHSGRLQSAPCTRK